MCFDVQKNAPRGAHQSGTFFVTGTKLPVAKKTAAGNPAACTPVMYELD